MEEDNSFADEPITSTFHSFTVPFHSSLCQVLGIHYWADFNPTLVLMELIVWWALGRLLMNIQISDSL